MSHVVDFSRFVPSTYDHVFLLLLFVFVCVCVCSSNYYPIGHQPYRYVVC